jgi:hypothetical protein
VVVICCHLRRLGEDACVPSCNYMSYFTGWFPDDEVSKKVCMNMYPEGLA